MSRTHKVVGGALLLGAAAAFGACTGNDNLLGITPADPLFTSYVALGNSITAGFQSGGITDSTQRQSYAVLLGRTMNTRFAVPFLQSPGCPPPISNALTGARLGGASSTGASCFLRTQASATALINNVAVPGVATADPTAVVGPNASALTTLFLGGETMVQKALDNRPTFATVWIGNNDILGPALSGFPSQATPVATFISNYAKMINQLVAGAPGLKGVLIGVVQVANVPLLSQAAVYTQPAVIAAASQVAGRPVFLDPTTCTGANLGALINFQYIVAIKSRPAAAPGAIFCQKVAGGGANDPGDNGILDITEQATVSSTISSYNAYIKAKADSIGFAFYDPNPTFVTLKADPTAIPPFPNLAAPTAMFGPYFSLDGVHPSATAHLKIANDLIGVINGKYSTKLLNVQ